MVDIRTESINQLDLHEAKYIANKLLGRLISSEMQNGRINTVEEQLLDVCLSNMLNEDLYIEVKSNTYGNFKMQLEEYILHNYLPNGSLYMSFADYDGMEGLDESEIEENEFYKSIEIPLRDIEGVKVHTLFSLEIKTIDDLIEIRMI